MGILSTATRSGGQHCDTRSRCAKSTPQRRQEASRAMAALSWYGMASSDSGLELTDAIDEITKLHLQAAA